VSARPGSLDRATADWHVQEVQAGAGHPGLAGPVIGTQAQIGQHLVDRRVRHRPSGFTRRRSELDQFAVEAHTDLAGSALLDDLAGGQQATVAQHPGRAEGGVPGERKLAAGGEDPHRVAPRVARDRERRLGVVELPRDGQQLGVAEPVGPVYDGKLVPGVRRLGEHVHDVVRKVT